MKEQLKHLLTTTVKRLSEQNMISNPNAAEVQIDRTRDKQFGDFSCNIAMILAKPNQAKPRDLAQQIIDHIPTADFVEKIEIAGPGFINFYLNETAQHSVINTILASGKDFGHSQVGNNEKINIEFVSSNPTGPLHVGHGRGAAYGAAVANLLTTAGFDVHREYYVNDAGRQMDILTTSIWLRYLELAGEKFRFPKNGYQGDYVKDMALEIQKNHADSLVWPASEVFENIPLDSQEDGSGDKEAHIDGLIERAKSMLGKNSYHAVHQLGLNTILDGIREDLADFGVIFDEWYSEQRVVDEDAITHVCDKLKAAGHTYDKEGGLWFKATEFGDDKDRVLLRSDGRPTYFASDAAYHLTKFERGAERLIDIFGADHHGYISRIKAAVAALGQPTDKFDIPIVQFAVLYRGDKKVQMSTRSGSFITLRELYEEVGKDAARFFYTMRKAEQHLDFDLELAKSQSSENPVYYIQYAHARICSIFRQLADKGLEWDQAQGSENLDLLLVDHEKSLIEKLTHYPELLQAAALNYEPHLLAHYLRELANEFHTYYNAHQFLVDDAALRNARLNLIKATQHILVNGLELLGVSAPEAM